MNEEMKTKAAGPSKTVTDFFRATRLHILEQARCILETEQVY